MRRYEGADKQGEAEGDPDGEPTNQSRVLGKVKKNEKCKREGTNYSGVIKKESGRMAAMRVFVCVYVCVRVCACMCACLYIKD